MDNAQRLQIVFDVLKILAIITPIVLAALGWWMRGHFATKEDVKGECRERKEALTRMGERIGDLESGRKENRRVADEAYRSAELTQRAQVEQAQRMTEEVIKPLRQMASDMSDVREMFARYMTHTDMHRESLARLEQRIDRVEARKPYKED